MNQAFVQALDTTGIPHADDFHSPGIHSVPYFQADLRAFLAWLPTHLGATAPASFSYRSAEPQFAAWGWSFRTQRSVKELVYLTGVSSGGLTAQGSGKLDVTTASLYQPGKRYRVAAGQFRPVIEAGADGRLRFSMDLGPSHLFQQYDSGPAATFGWRQVTVRIGVQ